MALTVTELVAKLGFQVDGQGLDKADKGISSLMGKATLLAASAYAVKKGFDLVVGAVTAAGRLESMNAEFEVMLGNAEAAKYLVQQIQKFAAETPFETEGLVSNVKLMMAFGQSANDALSAVKMLGDVAGADQERLNRLSLAYAQVMAAGKLQGQDLLQFVNAGFNPLKQLSQDTGKSMSELRKEMEKGLISAELVTKAFQSATGPGGRFFGNMEKQSQTLIGLWSTLKDTFNLIMQDLGGQLVPLVKDVIRGVIELSESIAGAYRQLGAFFDVWLSDGPTANEIAAYIAASFQTVADALMLAGSMAQTLVTWIKFLGAVASTVFMGMADYVMAPFRVFMWGVDKSLALLQKVRSVLPGRDVQGDLGRIGESRRWIQQHGGSGDFFGNLKATGGLWQGVGESGSKALEMWGMIGGTKGAAPGSAGAGGLSPTDAVLRALQGQTKVTNNNINNNVTVHAEGSLKDILTTQANAAFSLNVLQVRLAQAAV